MQSPSNSMAKTDSQGIFIRPSLADACVKRLNFDVKTFCPFCDTVCLAMQREHAVGPGIPRLDGTGSPDTIIRAVRQRIINSFQRMTRTGPWTKIRIKAFKVIP